MGACAVICGFFKLICNFLKAICFTLKDLCLVLFQQLISPCGWAITQLTLMALLGFFAYNILPAKDDTTNYHMMASPPNKGMWMNAIIVVGALLLILAVEAAIRIRTSGCKLNINKVWLMIK